MPTTLLPPRRRVLGGLCGAVLTGMAGTGCGHTTVLRGHRLSVALMEFRVRPAEIVVPAGRLRIRVENDGAMTHNLVVEASGPQRTDHRRAPGRTTQGTPVVARTPDLAPGARTTLVLTLGPGTYKTASTVGTDPVIGTAGTLRVTSK